MRFIQLRFRASSATAAHMALLRHLAQLSEGAKELQRALIADRGPEREHILLELEQMELVDVKGWIWNGFENDFIDFGPLGGTSLFQSRIRVFTNFHNYGKNANVRDYGFRLIRELISVALNFAEG